MPKDNLLKPTQGDGLTIAYHGLNLGRLSLCAGAAGSMRVMLANMLPWAEFRRTYGQPIDTRELVKRRIARLAGLIAGADALVAWGSWLIDQGYRGEMECIIAKIFGSEAHEGSGHRAVHEDARRPLVPQGPPRSATTSTTSWLRASTRARAKCWAWRSSSRWSRSTASSSSSRSARRCTRPASASRAWPIRDTSGCCRGPMWAYTRWLLGQKFGGRQTETVSGIDARLGDHLAFAQHHFGKFGARFPRR